MENAEELARKHASNTKKERKMLDCGYLQFFSKGFACIYNCGIDSLSCLTAYDHALEHVALLGR